MAQSICTTEGRTTRLEVKDITADPAGSVNTYTITLGTATAAMLDNMSLTGNLTTGFDSGTGKWFIFIDVFCPAVTSSASPSGHTFDVLLSTFNGALPKTFNCTIPNRWVSPEVTDLQANVSTVAENGTVVFTLTKSNTNGGVPAGTPPVGNKTGTIGYTVSGITASDIASAPTGFDTTTLTGDFTLTESTCATTLQSAQTFTLQSDAVDPEPDKTMCVTLDAPYGSVQECVTVTNVAAVVSYAFSGTNVTEGETITWTWTATNSLGGSAVANGTVLNYAITGTAVTGGKIAGVNTTGSFTVNSNTGSFTTATIDDSVWDSTTIATATITNGSPYNQVASVNVFNDDPECRVSTVSIPISWTPCYASDTGQLKRLTETETAVFHTGTTLVPTNVTVTQGSPSTIAVDSTVGIDISSGQGGIPMNIIQTFNNCPVDGPVTGTTITGIALKQN